MLPDLRLESFYFTMVLLGKIWSSAVHVATLFQAVLPDLRLNTEHFLLMLIGNTRSKVAQLATQSHRPHGRFTCSQSLLIKSRSKHLLKNEEVPRCDVLRMKEL